jgi:hypothetical protein
LDAIARPTSSRGEEVMSKEVALRNCPPGPFLFNGSLGFKTEYGSMECENPRDPKTLWRVGHHSDVYVMASGEAFWGGVTSKDDREALLVVPVDADTLARAALAAQEPRP